MHDSPAIAPDPWSDLRAHTRARLALGRTGSALPTAELLRFGMAHAQARDAVHIPLDADALAAQLQALGGKNTLSVHSAARDRSSYLLRPDLGRQLSAADADALRDAGHAQTGCDLLLVLADGLSSLALARHAPPLVQAILAQAPARWQIGPLVIARQARVALGDAIGALLGARMVAVLIGERPGLSAPDSLGLYLTWQPQIGRHDAQRNCISNIRPEGLSATTAATRFWWLCQEARRLSLTGVQLKDRSDALVLANSQATSAGAIAHGAQAVGGE